MFDIRSRRELAGIRQRDLAEAAGIHEKHLSRIENGRSNPTQGTLRQIDSAFRKLLTETVTPSHPADLIDPETGHPEKARSAGRVTQGFGWNENAPKGVRTGPQTKRYAQIARQVDVRQPLELLTAAAFWSPWGITEANDLEETPEFEASQKRAVRLIESQLEAIEPQSFTDITKAIVETALIHGFCPVEKVWQPSGERNILAALKQKPAWDWDPKVDQWGNLIGGYHYPTASTLDRTRLVWAVWPRIRNENWLGQSVVESFLTEVLAKDELQSTRAKNLRLAALRTIFHYYDGLGRPADRVAEVNALIDGAQSADIVHLSARYDMATGEIVPEDKIVTAEDRSQAKAFDGIASFNQELKRSIQGAFGIPGELGQVDLPNGSYARAAAMFDMFVAQVQSVRDWIEDVINRQVIADIIRYNPGYVFADTDGVKPAGWKLPRWGFQELEEDVTETKVKTYAAAISAGILDPSEPWIREELQWPAREADPNSQLT